MGAADVVAAATALIMRYEGFSAVAYPDPGDGTYTVGWGSTRFADGRRVAAGDSIAADDAEALLAHTVRGVVETLESLLPFSHLTPPQQAALVCFTYNVGSGNLYKSTLRRRLLAGDDPADAIAEEFPKWRKAGGKIMPGLVRRRAEEVELAGRATL